MIVTAHLLWRVGGGFIKKCLLLYENNYIITARFAKGGSDPREKFLKIV